MNVAKGILRLIIVILSIVPMAWAVCYCIFVCFDANYIMLGIFGVVAVWVVYWVAAAFIRFVVRGFRGKPWRMFSTTLP